MRAIQFSRYGSPSVLELVDLPLPHPGPGEVRVQVRACAVNHLDLDIRAGTSRMDHPWPHILGREIAGVVDALGSGVDQVAVGDAVVVAPIIPCGTCSLCRSGSDNLCAAAQMVGVNIPGGYGSHVVVPADGLLRLPEQVSFERAAATPIAYGTAWRALVTLAQTQPGEWVLITGAAGGLGTALVQVAILRGARVIAGVGSPAKLDYVRALGAEAGIDYSSSTFSADVVRLTQGAGVTVAVDHVGGALFQQVLGCMAPRGRLIAAGGHGGEIVGVDLVAFFRKELRLFGSRSQTRHELELVLRLLAEGSIRPVIDRVLPLDRACDAHELLAARAVRGKVVLLP